MFLNLRQKLPTCGQVRCNCACVTFDFMHIFAKISCKFRSADSVNWMNCRSF